MSPSRNQENFIKRFFSSYLFLFASVIVAAMVMFSYGRTYYQDYQVRQEIKRLQEDASKLETKKIELLEALRYVQSSSFVEEKARTELNMAKVGEKTLIIQSTTNPAIHDRQTNKTVLNLKSVSNYKKWWNLFME